MPSLTVHTPETVAVQTVYSTAGIILSGVVRFAYSALVGLFFGKEALGHVNSSISLALFASLLYPGACAMAVTKFLARSRGAKNLSEGSAVSRHLLRVTYLTGAVLGVVVAALSPALLAVSWPQAVLTGVLVVATSGYLFARSLLFGAGRVVRATVWDFATTLLSVVLLVAVLVGGLTWALLLPLLLGYVMYAGCNLPARRRETGAPLGSNLRREINGFIHLSLVNSLATSGVLQLSMVATQHWDPHQSGSYAAALALATPASLVSRSVSSVLFPSLAKSHGKGDSQEARRQVDTLTRGLFYVSVGIFGPLMVLSPLLIRLLFPRPELATAAVVLPVLLCAVMIQNMMIAPINTLLTQSQAHARIVMWSSVAGGVISLVLWLGTADASGYIGIAWGYLAGAVVASTIPFVVVWHQQSMRWSALTARVLIGTAGAAAVAWGAYQHHLSAVVLMLLAGGVLAAWLLLWASETRVVWRIVSQKWAARQASGE